MSYSDFKFMKYALRLASKGKGMTGLNPMVGAVVVKNGKIISTGYHKSFGKKHAERVALEKINEKDTTLYVTLEPCVHYGKTPPCADLIIEKGVKRVVISSIDENPIVKNNGVEKLKRNGISVETGLLDEDNRFLNRFYFKHIREKLPYIAIHSGISLDGKLTDKKRDSKWITSGLLREISHGIRGEFDSILCGKNTIIDDNPQLTIRHKEWKSKRFFRIILDRENTLSMDLNIFKDTDKFPLIIFSSLNAVNKTKKSKFHYFIEERDNRLDLKQVLEIVYSLNISSVLVEGGGEIIDSFLKNSLVDEVILFFGNKIVGGKESVEVFKSGFLLKNSIEFKHYSLNNINDGFVFRGYL